MFICVISETIPNMKDRLRGINSEQYIKDALAFSEEEKTLADQFNKWLPSNVVDCHSHCGLPEHALEIDNEMFHQMISTFQGFPLEKSLELAEIMFKDKKLTRLRMPFPFRGMDMAAANEYLLNSVKLPDKIVLCGVPTDMEYTNSMLRMGRFCALKMYHQQFNPPATTIKQYFPDEILQVAEKVEVPIILHLPKMITLCKEDLVETLEKFPKLRVSLAHLGLPHLVIPNLQETYDEISTYENVYMDTAMVPSKDVLKMAISAFGYERIMFGSDEPINLVRAKVYHNPKLGQRLITKYAYHWVDEAEHEEYKHLAKDLVHMHWPAVNAIKDAIEELYPDNLSKQAVVKNAIFNSNARKFFRLDALS